MQPCSSPKWPCHTAADRPSGAMPGSNDESRSTRDATCIIATVAIDHGDRSPRTRLWVFGIRRTEPFPVLGGVDVERAFRPVD